MPGLARVYCDASPLSHSPWSISDYSGLQIFSLCSNPLTYHTDSLIPGAAQHWESAADYKTFTFYLRDDLCWKDGTSITGFDFVRGLQRLAQPGNRYASLLSDVCGFKEWTCGQSKNLQGLSATPHTITLQLRNSNRLLPLLLSFPGASPTHALHSDWCPGVYEPVAKNQDSWLLEPQGNHKSACSIAFDFSNISQDPFAVQRWKDGRIDLTWDTYFPYEQISSYEQSSEFHTSNPRIAVVLSKQACSQSIPCEAFEVLCQVIDRSNISASLFDRVKPLFGFGQGAASTPQEVAPLAKTVHIRVSYEDFFPNAEILTAVAQQARPYNIVIEPVCVAYGARPDDLGLRLELYHNPFHDPFLLYRNEAKQKNFYDSNPRAWARFMEHLSQYQAGKGDLDQHTQSMDEILQSAQRLIPLVELSGYYLKNKALVQADFCPGLAWRMGS